MEVARKLEAKGRKTDVLSNGISGRSLKETMQILNLKQSLELMFEMAKDGTFCFSKSAACRFHDVVARDEALKWDLDSGGESCPTDRKSGREREHKFNYHNMALELDG